VCLVAAALAAILAAVAATAGVRDGVCHHVERLHRRHRIVARDDELARARAPLGRLGPDQHAQARPGMQRCWERIVDELPVPALALERDARHVQLAFADVANRDRALAIGVEGVGKFPAQNGARSSPRAPFLVALGYVADGSSAQAIHSARARSALL
jgi:hypothetical protein